MALHKNFPKDKFVILDPEIRWFPADEALRTPGGYEKLLPPSKDNQQLKVGRPVLAQGSSQMKYQAKEDLIYNVIC